MTNIVGRLKKVEDLLWKLAPNKEDLPMFFVRFGDGSQSLPDENEIKFLREHPDYKGQIYRVWIGEHPDGKGECPGSCN